MANALPQIKVTNSRTAEGQSPDVSPVLSSFGEGTGGTKDGRPKLGNPTECKVTYPIKTISSDPAAAAPM